MVMVNGKKRRNIILLGCAISIVLLSVAIGAKLLIGHRATPPLPKQLISQASFPIYYPSKLPEGYVLKTGSVGGDSSAVYYTLTNGTDKSAITVTLQATPSKFDASQIIGKNPIPTTITPVGTLYNLSTGGSSKYMLSTGRTLLFITSPTTIEGKSITTITNSLTDIKSK